MPQLSPAKMMGSKVCVLAVVVVGKRPSAYGMVFCSWKKYREIHRINVRDTLKNQKAKAAGDPESLSARDPSIRSCLKKNCSVVWK